MLKKWSIESKDKIQTRLRNRKLEDSPARMLVSWQFFPCWNGVFSLLLWVKVWEDCRRSLVLIFFGGRYANTCTYPFLWSRAVEHPQFVDGGIFQWCIAELHRIALYLYISIYIYICIRKYFFYTHIYIYTHKPVYIIEGSLYCRLTSDNMQSWKAE